MTVQEFNTKYKQYIPKGWGGLEFDIPEVTNYLDDVMINELCLIPGFEINQIKLKFGMARFYFETNMQNKAVQRIIQERIENKINDIVKNELAK